MNRSFEHEGKTFEVRSVIVGACYSVRVFLNDAQVRPVYSATLEVGQNYFAQHAERIVDELAKAAKSDILNGIYFKA